MRFNVVFMISLVVCVMVMMVTPVRSQGTTYFMGEFSCDDDGQGTEMTPFCTMDAALTQLRNGAEIS